MTVLFEISHPAHVHIFKNQIINLYDRDDPPIIYAKQKDSVKELLDEYQFEYFLAAPFKSNMDKALTLHKHIIIIRKLIKEHKIQRTIGVHPVHSSIASLTANIESFALSDTEHAMEQIILYWPSSKKIFTPYSFNGRWTRNQITYPSIHELAYLHPNVFTHDKEKFANLNFEKGTKTILYRMIEWSATHDFGIKKNIAKEIQLILSLSKNYNIIVSYEGNNPPKQIQHLIKQFPKSNLHHILSEVSLYIGSGATTASENACLGNPSIYLNPLKLGYIEELANKWKMIFYPNTKRIENQIEELLQISTNEWKKRSNKMIQSSIETNQLIGEIIAGNLDGEIGNINRNIINQFKLGNPNF